MYIYIYYPINIICIYTYIFKYLSRVGQVVYGGLLIDNVCVYIKVLVADYNNITQLVACHYYILYYILIVRLDILYVQ